MSSNKLLEFFGDQFKFIIGFTGFRGLICVFSKA
jgi:hypothetical protein